MISEEVLSLLIEKLSETGLAHYPGAFAYSHLETISPGSLYLLGYNPGGDPDAENVSVQKHLISVSTKESGWSAYVNDRWAPRGHLCEPGAAGMQIRVRNLLKSLGFQPYGVFASNLIFVRSRVADTLTNAQYLAKQCWPVHEFVLHQVRPRAILTIGKEAFDFIYKLGVPVVKKEAFSSGRSKLPCYSAEVKLGELKLKLVSVPHLGDRIRYNISEYPHVVPVLKDRLGL